MGPVEAAPEYRVIVDANNLTVEIENELSECCEGRAELCLVSLTAPPVPKEGRGRIRVAFPTGPPRGLALRLYMLVQGQV